MLASAPAPICHIHNETVASCSLTGRRGPAGELREDTAAVFSLLAQCGIAPATSFIGFITEGSFSVATVG